jgi:hypothetical protein
MSRAGSQREHEMVRHLKLLPRIVATILIKVKVVIIVRR